MNPTRGIALKVAATLMFTLVSVCVKAVSPHIPPGEAVFARSFFALVPILAVLLWRGEARRALTTHNLLGHLWRGIVGVAAMALSFAALGYLPLPEAMAISYAVPLITVVLAVLVLGETLRIYRSAAVMVGFAGILVILWPRLSVLGNAGTGSDELIGAVLALAAAFLIALAMILVRRLVATENTSAIVVYFSLTGSLFALATVPFGWAWPAPWEAAVLVASGVFGGIGQVLLTEAYRHAETSTVAPFDYTSMIWALALGYILFAEVPDTYVLAGAAIVICAGIFIIFRERALGIRRVGARKVTTPQG